MPNSERLDVNLRLTTIN